MTPALDSIIRALSDRGGQTEAQRPPEAANTTSPWTLSFMPRDSVDIMLAGQTIVFNEASSPTARETFCVHRTP